MERFIAEEQYQNQSNENNEEYFYNDLQFQRFLVEPISSSLLDNVFIRDLVLSNLNEIDIYKARNVIELIGDLENWGISKASKLFKVTLMNLVNTARARGGFERLALITKHRNESANIMQKSTQEQESFFKRLIRRR